VTFFTGRAYWSLGNAHSAMGNHEKALHYASKHLEISKQVIFISLLSIIYEVRLINRSEMSLAKLQLK